MHYRADIDGLRAVAVLSVLFFHAGITAVSGGYVGVDVFFVISGFVITSGIVREYEQSRFSIAAFYDRRIRRIFPALIAVIVTSLVAFTAVMAVEDGRDFSRSAVAAMLSVSNIFFWKTSGYFDPAAGLRPLLHTWSLAVEEQFYLVIPLLLSFTLRRSRAFSAAVLIALGLASLGLSVYLTDRAPSANFYSLPTRAWELVIGCLLALQSEPLKRLARFAPVMGWAGLALIIASVVLYDGDTPFPGAAAVPPTLGAALIIASGTIGSSTVNRWLSTRIMVGIGAISYSLYLVHWPVIVFARFWTMREPGPLSIALICAVSIGLAVLSWKFVEAPFRHPSRAFDRGNVFRGAALMVAIVCGFAFVSPAFAPRRLAPALVASAVENRPLAFQSPCFLENEDAGKWRAELCTRTTGAASNALLWGDSFAAHYVAGLMTTAEPLDVNIIQYTSAGCPPILDYKSYALPHCQPFNRHALDVIRASDIKSVILSARWDLVRGRRLAELQPTIKTLLAAGVSVFVVGISPQFPLESRYLAYRRAGMTRPGEGAWPIGEDHYRRNDEIKKLAVASGARFIDVMAGLCTKHSCPYMHDGKLLYLDYGHFTAEGSVAAVECCFPFVRRTRQGQVQE